MTDRRNASVSVRRWIAVGFPILTFIGGCLITAVTIGTIYGKAINRLDNVESLAAGNSQDNEKLELVMNSEIRAVRTYMFSLNANIAVIGAKLGIERAQLSILEISTDPVFKGEINEK